MANTHQLPFQSLDVYVAARELAARAHALALPDDELRDQLRRAFALSAGSLCEAAAALDLGAAIGLVPREEAAALVALAARVKRMLRALTAPAR
jgi:hypothetical protein